MKIEDLRTDSTQDRARVAATVIWEDCDRPTQEIHFETTRPFADGLACNPHAFLTACFMPAMRHGERRVSMDAEICPELRNGLVTAMSWIRRWFESERRLVLIEAKTNAHPLSPRTPERAGVFLSGGIDSLASLRANRLAFPLTHAGSFKDGLFINGIEKGKDAALHKLALRSLTEIVREDASKPGMLNCGQCEKCLRTKLGLLALGKLDKTSASPKIDSEKSLLAKLKIANKPSYAYLASCYAELIPALSESGHGDLARELERVLAISSTRTRAGKNRGRLKQIDQKIFNGNLHKIYKKIICGRKAVQRNR